MTGQFDGKIALVTGASRGIGYAIAKALGAQGAHVIAVARTIGGLEALDDEIQEAGGSATLTPLDLTQFAGIDRLGAAIAERWGKLDILVGNAAMLGELSPVPHIEPKMFDEVMATNLTANWRLIRSLDTLLRAADAARVLFVTSSVGSKPRAYWSTYAISKAGLDAMAQMYAAEVASTAMKVNLLNPGATRTDMRALAMPGEDPNILPTADDVAAVAAKMVSSDWTQNGTLANFRDF
ncbi:MAG: SDR family NAD(P)-dependent oxidoreductase [Proteobacteria bacterium]|nr:SDR family NAD(P)-dependent oxidoreductase [Pseudomonadota bacterium]